MNTNTNSTNEIVGRANALYDRMVNATYESLLADLDSQRQLVFSIDPRHSHSIKLTRSMHPPLCAVNSMLCVEKRLAERLSPIPDSQLARVLAGVRDIWATHGDAKSPHLKRLSRLLTAIESQESWLDETGESGSGEIGKPLVVLKRGTLRRFPSLNQFRDKNGQIVKGVILPILVMLVGVAAVSEASSLGVLFEEKKFVRRCEMLYGSWKVNDPIIRRFSDIVGDMDVNKEHFQAIGSRFIHLCCCSKPETAELIEFMKPIAPAFFNNPADSLRQLLNHYKDGGERGTAYIAVFEQSPIRPPDFSLASAFLERGGKNALRPDEPDSSKAADAWDGAATQWIKRVKCLWPAS